MQVRTRMCTSLDGYISNADGLPVQLSDPEFDPEAYGLVELQAGCDAVLMGLTTLGPAIDADPWPWSDIDVFVLGSERPPGIPDEVVVDGDPDGLLERVREANHGGDVHLIGVPPRSRPTGSGERSTSSEWSSFRSSRARGCGSPPRSRSTTDSS